MLNPPTLQATPNAISLLVSESGAMRYVNQDGLIVDLFGQVVAHASRSAPQATKKELPTSATSGLSGSISSASAALQLSLVSKLKQQLDTAGSTLFKLTWKEKTTPAGRSVSLLRASGHRTSGSDSGSWPTTLASDSRGSAGVGKRELPNAVKWVGWPTPQTMDTLPPMDYEKRLNHPGRPGRTVSGNLREVVTIVGWPTPIVGDTTGGPRPPDSRRGPAPGLQAAANLTSWPTTSTRDHKGGYRGGAYERRQDQHGHVGRNGATGFWDNCDWLSCRDGKYRPVESGTFPLAHGSTARVGRLRAYGNAIVPQAAQALIEAYLET